MASERAEKSGPTRTDATSATRPPEHESGGADALVAVQRLAGNRAASRLADEQSGALPQTVDIAERIRRSTTGKPLDEPVQRRLESGLGTDLSGVRVHTDPEADRLSRAVDAVAFTTGSDIFFRSGTYRPESQDGMHLLAHEAAHTVQQAKGSVSGKRIGDVSISDPGDVDERAADRAASQVVTKHSPRDANPVQRSVVAKGTTTADGVVSIQRVRGAAQGLKIGTHYDREETDQRPDLVEQVRVQGATLKKYYDLMTAVSRIDPNAADAAQQLDVIRQTMPLEVPPPKMPTLHRLTGGLDVTAALAVIRGKYDEQKEFCRRQGISLSDAGIVDEPALQARRVGYHRDPASQQTTLVTPQGGRLMRSATHPTQPGAPVETGPSSTYFSKNGWEIFVVGMGGDIHMGSHQIGQFHHSSLLAGANVAMGGEMKVAAGRVETMTNKSGHYQPTAAHFKHFLAELQQGGMTLDFKVTGFGVPDRTPAAGATPAVLNTGQEWLDSLSETEKPEFEDAKVVFESLQRIHGPAVGAYLVGPPPGLGWRTVGNNMERPDGGGWVRVSHDEVRQAIETKFGAAQKRIRKQPNDRFSDETITWE
jgi:hypothetical protein